MTQTSTVREQLISIEDWRPLFVGGLLIAFLGVLAIVFPLVTGLALSAVFGALLVVGALVHVFQAFSAREWTGFGWQVLLAVVYGFAGIALLINPVIGLASVTLLLIAYFLVDGIAEIAMGVRARGTDGWGWILASGATALLLAGILIAGWPTTALWTLGVLFGVNLVTTGAAMVLIANTSRHHDRTTSMSTG